MEIRFIELGVLRTSGLYCKLIFDSLWIEQLSIPLINYLDEDETDVKTENENDPENPEKVTEKSSPKKKSKKEYTCQLCFKIFKDSYKLKRHGKVHQVRVSERISCEQSYFL